PRHLPVRRQRAARRAGSPAQRRRAAPPADRHGGHDPGTRRPAQGRRPDRAGGGIAGYYRVTGQSRRMGMTSQADHNLAALAESAFRRLGDCARLVCEGRVYRSGELFDRACRVSSGLVKLGISPGERVVVLMANCPEVGITYSAIWRAGAVVTPVVFLITPPELQHILADSGAVAVVTTPQLLATVTAAAAGAPPRPPRNRRPRP